MLAGKGLQLAGVQSGLTEDQAGVDLQPDLPHFQQMGGLQPSQACAGGAEVQLAGVESLASLNLTGLLQRLHSQAGPSSAEAPR